jgi:hypothetical protein
MLLARAATPPLVRQRTPLEKFPSGVPFPEGTWIAFETEQEAPKVGRVIVLSAQAEASVEELSEFYVTELRAGGWEVTTDGGSNQEAHLIAKQGARGLDIHIQSDSTFFLTAFGG